MRYLYKVGLALVAPALLFSAVQLIDCGGPGDTGFSAGTWPAPGGTIAYTIPVLPPGTTDATLRYCVSCSYTIPTTEGQPYLVTLTFIEPTVQAAGQRVFSVSINDQPVLRDFDVFAAAGFLTQIQRSFVAVPNNAQLVIAFSASVRNAVISSIQVSPLFVLSVHTSGLLMLKVGDATIIGVRGTPEEIAAPGWVTTDDLGYSERHSWLGMLLATYFIRSP